MPHNAFAGNTHQQHGPPIKSVTIEVFWVFASPSYRKLLCELAGYSNHATERIMSVFHWRDLTADQQARIGYLIGRFCERLSP